MTDNPNSLMHKISGKFGEVNGRVAFEAAKAGDRAGLEVVEKYTEYVADGLTSVINIFVFGLYLLNSFISTNFLIGFKRYSPSLLIPPPITKISGSKIFMTLVNGGERCTCGKHGCWETYGSVTALINQTKLKMTDNPDSLMQKFRGNSVK